MMCRRPDAWFGREHDVEGSEMLAERVSTWMAETRIQVLGAQRASPG